MSQKRYRIPSSSALQAFEAAAAGKGIALGWQGLIERHLENGVLAPLVTDYVSFDRGIYAILTARGRGHPLARQFMDCLGNQ